MKLKDLMKGISILELRGNVDMECEISGIAYHSEQVQQGEVFVAIKGYVTDGHKYLKHAKDNGAIFAIVEDLKDVYIPQIRVENSRQVLADISNNFYDEPSKKLNVIGITATNGKTTTSFMADEILKEAKVSEGIIGTVATRFNNTLIPSILTTPESLDLQKYFCQMERENVDTVVMEVSSSAEEMERVRNIDFDIVSFGNISREHIDQHGSFENYYREKSKLIQNVKANAVAILNMDFPEIRVLREQTKAQVLTFSLENQDYDFSIANLDLSTGHGKYIFYIHRDIQWRGRSIEKNSFPIELGTIGFSSVMNSVIAIIIALVMGIDIPSIQKALKNFRGVERRFELIYDEKFKILDDHFANEKNIDATMNSLLKMDYKNLHFLYAIRGNRGVEVNRESAERMCYWLKQLHPKRVMATLSRDQVGKKDEVSAQELEIYQKVLKSYDIDCPIYDTLEEAIYQVLSFAEEGDIVLLAGCQGMDQGAQFVMKYLLEKNLVDHVEEFTSRIKNRIC